MASRRVSDFPVVLVALEHLKELDEHLKEAGVPFAPEASLHLTEVTAAVSELDADRRASRERLEVKTIQNSRLRHQINGMRERISEEILADVAAARASNAEEMEQLRQDLRAASQLQEETVKRWEALSSQNKSLRPERDQAKAEHEAVIATLNELITQKYDLQMQLKETGEKMEELKASIAGVEQDGLTLRQNMILERESYSLKTDGLSKEVDHTEEEIKKQKQWNRRSRRELDSINIRKQKTQGRLDELTVEMAKLESNVQRLTASRCHHENQLEGEVQKHQELRQQRETLKEELHELKQAFGLALQQLQEEIAAMDGKIEKVRASRRHFQDAWAQICEVFQHRLAEENKARTQHTRVSQQLERSRLRLEERVASIAKHNMEIKAMEKQMRELLETDLINRRLFERNQEELCGNVDAGMKNVSQFQEEKMRLQQLLERVKRNQEEHVVKMTSDISSTRRRYEELLQEEAALQKQQPKSVDADLLRSHVAQSEEDYKQIVSRHSHKLQQLTADAEKVAESVKEMQKKVEEKEEMLKEAEAKWSEEQSRLQRLEGLTNDLRKRKRALVLSIQELKEKTSCLLQPKEKMKAELEALRVCHTDTLNKQASELRAVEVSIYNNSVKLEQVSMENSRLQLRNRQMMEDIVRTRQHTDKYQQETQRFRQGTEALQENLQEAWREELLFTQEHQSGDDIFLVSMSSLLDHLKTRRQQLGNISTLLHQQMHNFSKRLGDKATQ